MAETFEYSKAKHDREVVVPHKRSQRLQLAVAVAFIAALFAAYLSQHVLHLW